MDLKIKASDTFDRHWLVEIDTTNRITVHGGVGSGLRKAPGIYLWLARDMYSSRIIEGYIGESKNLHNRINNYLTGKPNGTARRIAQSMHSWQSHYKRPVISLAVVYRPSSVSLAVDGDRLRQWNPAEISDRRLVESSYIVGGKARGYTLLNLT